MCGQCRSIDVGGDWFTAAVPDSLRDRRLARAALARAASDGLAAWRVQVTAYPGALTLDVRTRTGASATVSRLSEILPAAERLTGRSFDPLADEEIEARERRWPQ
jgi:hypothetical protein